MSLLQSGVFVGLAAVVLAVAIACGGGKATSVPTPTSAANTSETDPTTEIPDTHPLIAEAIDATLSATGYHATIEITTLQNGRSETLSGEFAQAAPDRVFASTTQGDSQVDVLVYPPNTYIRIDGEEWFSSRLM